MNIPEHIKNLINKSNGLVLTLKTDADMTASPTDIYFQETKGWTDLRGQNYWLMALQTSSAFGVLIVNYLKKPSSFDTNTGKFVVPTYGVNIEPGDIFLLIHEIFFTGYVSLQKIDVTRVTFVPATEYNVINISATGDVFDFKGKTKMWLAGNPAGYTYKIRHYEEIEGVERLLYTEEKRLSSDEAFEFFFDETDTVRITIECDNANGNMDSTTVYGIRPANAVNI